MVSQQQTIADQEQHLLEALDDIIHVPEIAENNIYAVMPHRYRMDEKFKPEKSFKICTNLLVTTQSHHN